MKRVVVEVPLPAQPAQAALVQVHDERDVGLVDARAKRNRDSDDQAVLVREALLVQAPRGPGEPRGVRHRGDAMLLQESADRLRRVPGQAVDDAGVTDVLLAEEAQHLARGSSLVTTRYLVLGWPNPPMKVTPRCRRTFWSISARVCSPAMAL